MQSWQPFLENLPARVEPLNGTERWYTFQTIAVEQTKFTIRYHAKIDASMRILWQGDYYEITSVIDVQERKIQMILLAVKWGRQ